MARLDLLPTVCHPVAVSHFGCKWPTVFPTMQASRLWLLCSFDLPLSLFKLSAQDTDLLHTGT